MNLICMGGIKMGTLQIVAIIIAVVLALLSIGLIVVILRQSGSTEGLGSVMGRNNTDSFLGRNKTKSKEGKLVFITKILTICIVILALALAVVVAI